MNVQQRVEILVQLGVYISAQDPQWEDAKRRAEQFNHWFTPAFTSMAANSIASAFLQKEKLEQWVAHYHVDDNLSLIHI